MSRLIQITDWFVIATGTSQRHVQTLAEAVEERLDSFERKPIRIEGRQSGSWLLIDYGDFVVHLFLPETRAYYDLERLWGDAPRIEHQAVSSEADFVTHWYNPPLILGAVAQLGRALAWHARGQGFKSPQLHQETRWSRRVF